MSLLDRLNKIKDESDLKGRRVIVRADFNITLGNDGVIDEHEAYRIHRALPTLKYLVDQGARTIVLSHYGREGKTLKPIADYLNRHSDIGFIPELFSQRVDHAIQEMPHGSCILLENLRSDPREELGDETFAHDLARYGDLYVNDAFSVSHREHASISLIPKHLPSYIGIQCAEEIANLERILDPQKPFIVIFGGAKFSTKLDLIRKFLDVADAVFIGGALANTFLKAKGYEVGQSLVDDSAHISDLLDHPSITLPRHIVVGAQDNQQIRESNNVSVKESIMDVAPQSINDFEHIMQSAQTILWNGPLGNYENGYVQGTERCAELLAQQSAVTIVGGGDTVASIGHLGLENTFDFISAAGGAMLDFLVDGSLPGIDALLAHHPTI